MSNLSNHHQNYEQRDRYRQYTASLDLSMTDQDALIDIVYSIISHFVDQAFYVQTDQITLGSIAKTRSSAPLADAMIESRPKNHTAHAPADGVESDSNPLESPEP